MSIKGSTLAPQRAPQAEPKRAPPQDSTWGDDEHLWEGGVSQAPLPELPLEEVAPTVVELKFNYRRVAEQLAQSGLFELPLTPPSIPPGGFSAPPSVWRDEVSSLPVHSGALSQRPASLKPRAGSFEMSAPPQHDGWLGEPREASSREASSREVTKPAGAVAAEQLERVKRYQEARAREQMSERLKLTSHHIGESLTASQPAPHDVSVQRRAEEEARLHAELRAKRLEEEARLHAELKAKRLEEEARLKEARAELESLQERLARELALAEEARLEAEREAEREAALEAQREAALEAEREAQLKAAREARLEAEREAALEAERLKEERRRHGETLELLLGSFQREGFTENLKALWRERDQLERLERERLEREAREELEELFEEQMSWKREALQGQELTNLALDSLPVNPLEGVELSLPPLASDLIQALMPYSEPMDALSSPPATPQTLGEDDETLPPSAQPIVDELSEAPLTSSASAPREAQGGLEPLEEPLEEPPADQFHTKRPEAKRREAHSAPMLGLREQRGLRWERDERLGSRAERAQFSAPSLLSKSPSP